MNKSKLGQFYTPENISELMAELTSKILSSRPKKVVDMACGSGSLLIPTQRMYPEAEIHSFDIDSSNIEYLKNNYPDWKSHCVNSFEHSFPENYYDLAVGNPPFIKIKATNRISNLIQRNFECAPIQTGKSIRAEIAFIAQYIESTKIGAAISIIVPESIISNERMQFVRKALFKNLSNISIYEIGAKYFDSAEVRTYLISGKKSILPDTYIEVGAINKDGQAAIYTSVKKELCIERADTKYLINLNHFEQLQKKYVSIGEVVTSVDRGNKTRRQLEKENTAFFHSSSFMNIDDSKVELSGDELLINRYHAKHVAKYSDIIIPRVGRNCHKNQALVYEGNAVITDSVLKLNLPEKHAQKVYASLVNEEGQFWRNIHAKGSCTRLLTIKDVMKMPLTSFPRR